MDKITERQLKMLVENQNWDAIRIFAEVIIKKWHNVPVKRESEFETLWNCALQEGKIEGVRELLDSIEKITLDVN